MQQTPSDPDAHNLAIAQGLEAHGWAVVPDYLPGDRVEALVAEYRRLWSAGHFRQAAVGHGGDMQVRPEIRADHINWLESGDITAPQRPLLDKLEALRGVLNRTLFLGLREFEAHMAIYPAGAFYRRHLDNFRDSNARRVTAVFYLNRDWQEEHGGALRAYLGDSDTVAFEVLPQAGTLAVFLSTEFYHEVLPAQRERLSLTGWFRV